MDKQLKTELKKILTGRTVRDEEGWLVAIPDGNYLIYHGVADRTGYRTALYNAGAVIDGKAKLYLHSGLAAIFDAQR